MLSAVIFGLLSSTSVLAFGYRYSDDYATYDEYLTRTGSPDPNLGCELEERSNLPECLIEKSRIDEFYSKVLSRKRPLDHIGTHLKHSALWVIRNLIILLVSTWLGKWISNQITVYHCSRMLNYFKRSPALLPESVRTTFMDLPFSESKLAQGHTHPEAAADRTSASLFVDRLAAMLGRTAYYVQRSRSDERRGRQGSREYYWAKDLTVNPSPLVLPANPLVALVDVDQYLDMNYFLNTVVQPVIVYTFQPTSVARVGSNYSFTFNQDNTVTYNVSGGGAYTHQVWNYSSDHLIVASKWMGIPWRTSTYLVDRRATSQDHELILLTPLGTWSGFGAWLSARCLTGRVLKRLAIVQNIKLKPTFLHPFQTSSFLRLMTSSMEGLKISTGKPGNYASATITAVSDNTVATLARTSKYPLTLPNVLPHVDGDRVAGAVLLEYHLVASGDKPDVVCPVSTAVRRYQYNPHSYDPLAKPSMVAFMSPLVHGAFAPDRTKSNEVRCVEERIENVRPPELPMTSFLTQVMEEFEKHMIPDDLVHTFDPVDEDELLRRQFKPTQRRILSDAESRNPDRKINTFMKAEAYSNIKDPRPISVMDGVDKRDYSKFLYAFEKILKDQAWYAFALTPKLVAARVASILEYANMATTTDFHRFDGHGSNLMRELEQRLLMRAFRLQHHSKLLELHRAQYKLKAYGTFGTKYDSHYARASGSPETSLFNSLVNAFVSYLAIRMTKQDGLYVPPGAAYQRLGVYAGDDGISVDISPKTLQKAAAMIGQDLKTEVVNRGEFGINFLARVYSADVWFGDENSCCDLPRQLTKFHVTTRIASRVTPIMKLLEKVRCFLLSDENTPIIGDYCRAVAALHHGPIVPSEETREVRLWLAQWDKEHQYMNEPADWMISYAQRCLPEFDYKRFTSWVSECKTIKDLMSPPMFQEPPLAKSSVPVVVDEVVIPLDVKLPELPLRKEDIKERKSCGSSTITIVPEPIFPAKPLSPKNGFDAFKAKKIADGTWIDKPLQVKCKENSVKIRDKPKRTQAEFEAWKQAKVLAGTWSDRPPSRVPR